MQQLPMIGALKILADRTPNDGAKASINMTVSFLEACNSIFESGILSDKAVKVDDQSVLENIRKGHQFFESWLTSLISNSACFSANDSKQKLFLAWQTWDLLRIMTHGFSELCNDFLQKYNRDFYIMPKRLNGSAIETLFSQFKFLTGGKLSATTIQLTGQPP
jgi:hypothetical protein